MLSIQSLDGHPRVTQKAPTGTQEAMMYRCILIGSDDMVVALLLLCVLPRHALDNTTCVSLFLSLSLSLSIYIYILINIFIHIFIVCIYIYTRLLCVLFAS